MIIKGFPGDSVLKNPAASSGDPGLIPGLGRSPEEWNGYPLQYSCLENPMDRGIWQTNRPWGPKKLDMTEWLSMYACDVNYLYDGYYSLLWAFTSPPQTPPEILICFPSAPKTPIVPQKLFLLLWNGHSDTKPHPHPHQQVCCSVSKLDRLWCIYF